MRRAWLTVGLLASGCGERLVRLSPDAGTDAGSGAAVVARFEPGGTTPWPSDAQRDAAAGRLRVPGTGELGAWLNTLDAWPADVVARARFSGPLDAATATASVRAFAVTDAAAASVPVMVSATATATALDLRARWSPGRTYLVAMTDGLRGAAGDPVVGDDDFPPERDRLRATLAAAGLDADRVVLAWTFTISAAPAVVFAPEDGVGPFPSDLLRDAQGRLALPPEPLAPAVYRRLLDGIATLDGFSTTAPARIRATVPIGAAAGADLRFLRAGGVATRAVPAVAVGGDTLRAAPESPLAGGALHAFVAAGLRAADGRLLVRGYRQQLLFMREEVAELPGGAELEAARSALQPLFDAAPAPPGRASLQVAMPFTTQPIAAPLAETLDAALDAGLAAAPAEVTDAPVPVTHLNVARVLHGYLMSRDRLDPRTQGFRPDGGWEPVRVPFLMCVPKGQGPFRTAVFGHGLGTAKEFVHLLCDHLAAKGLATVSIDLPYHGERTHCLYDTHCEWGAVCGDDGTCSKAGAPARLAMAPGTEIPVATGAAFIALDDLWKTRDHFVQSLADLGALRRSLEEASAAWPVPLAPSAPRYAGQSLGGLLGTVFAAGAAEVDAALLNVAGAGIVDIMDGSYSFRPGYRAVLAQHGIRYGTPEFDAFEDAARWALDLVDPANHAALVGGRALLQMAVGDTVVPNSSTLRLQALSGAPREDYAGTHGFLTDPSEPAYLPAVRRAAEYLGAP